LAQALGSNSGGFFCLPGFDRSDKGVRRAMMRCLRRVLCFAPMSPVPAERSATRGWLSTAAVVCLAGMLLWAAVGCSTIDLRSIAAGLAPGSSAEGASIEELRSRTLQSMNPSGRYSGMTIHSFPPAQRAAFLGRRMNGAAALI